jgi:predicted DsbA family dithiol-disulfide isomerase
MVILFLPTSDDKMVCPLLAGVAEAGLDRNRAEGVLNGDDGLEPIREAEALSRPFRVEGVLFVIINRKVNPSGAQPPDALKQTIAEG